MDDNELLKLAAIAESGSEHPLAKDVITKAKEKGISIVSPDSLEAVAGHGLRASYSNHEIMIGNRKMILDNNISIPGNAETTLSELEQDGKTAVLVSIDNHYRE